MKRYTIREGSLLDYIISGLPFILIIVLSSIGYFITGTV
jgi:hypothetical protein|nr:MAG TPA: Cytochrome c oxidase assembly protein [Caudoviricetes sp.]